jgi:hypothetical protein
MREEEGFEDVGLNDDPKPSPQQAPPPKKRGFLSRLTDSSNNDQATPGATPGQDSKWHFGGRKRGQSGQGAELGSMPIREDTPKPVAPESGLRHSETPKQIETPVKVDETVQAPSMTPTPAWAGSGDAFTGMPFGEQRWNFIYTGGRCLGVLWRRKQPKRPIRISNSGQRQSLFRCGVFDVECEGRMIGDGVLWARIGDGFFWGFTWDIKVKKWFRFFVVISVGAETKLTALVVSLDRGWKIILARVYMSSIGSGDGSIIEAFCIQYLL